MRLSPFTSIRELLNVMRARDLDLHVERAGSRARASAGEEGEVWVGRMNGDGGYTMEAEGSTPAEAVAALWEEVLRRSLTPTERRASMRLARLEALVDLQALHRLILDEARAVPGQFGEVWEHIEALAASQREALLEAGVAPPHRAPAGAAR